MAGPKTPREEASQQAPDPIGENAATDQVDETVEAEARSAPESAGGGEGAGANPEAGAADDVAAVTGVPGDADDAEISRTLTQLYRDE